MTVPTTNIRMSAIQSEFGGSNPIKMSEYWGAHHNVPSSGAISIGDFGNTAAVLTMQSQYFDSAGFAFYGFITPADGGLSAGSLTTPNYRGYDIQSLFTGPNFSIYGSNGVQIQLGPGSSIPQNTFTSMSFYQSNLTLMGTVTSASAGYFSNTGGTQWIWNNQAGMQLANNQTYYVVINLPGSVGP